MDERKEAFQKKTAELSKRCTICMKQSYFAPTPDRCEECNIGRRIRALETEYSDVTGWTHSKW